MFGGVGDARIDERAVGEVRAGLPVRAFEGEMRKGGGGSVGSDGAVVEVGGGVMDGRDYDVACLGDVLRESLGYEKA